MRKKNSKLIISILILVLSLLIGTKSYGDFDVLAEDFDKTCDVPPGYASGRYIPNNLYDNSMFFCIQHGGHYRNYHATLSSSDKGEFTIDDDGHTGEKVEHNITASPETTMTFGNSKTTMHYTRGEKITNQDFAYILTTAKAKGYAIMSADIQDAIWDSSANKAVDGEINNGNGNASSKEGRAYQIFYNTKETQKELTPDNPINLKDKTEYSYEEDDKKPTVAVDSDKETYTVGTFQFTHINGDYTNEEQATVAEAEFISPEQYVEKYREILKKLMNKNNAKLIYKDLRGSIKEEEDKNGDPIENYNGIRYNSKEAAANFITVYDGIRGYLDDENNFTNKNTSNTIQTIKNRIDALKSAVKQLKFKKGKSNTEIKEAINNIKDYEININMSEAAANITTKFAYTKSITLIGIDANGNERELATNSVKDDTQMEILDINGNKIKRKILENDEAEQTGILSSKEYNIPQSGDVFYVKFKLGKNDQDIKKIKIKVGTRYLDSCKVIAYEYSGKVYDWKWTDEKKEACGHTSTTTTTTTIKKFGGFEVVPNSHRLHIKWIYEEIVNTDEDSEHFHAAVLHIKSTDTDTQWLTGIPEEEFKNNATKVWQDKDLKMGGEDGIDITMELGGYAFLDQPKGKANEENNIREDDEGLSNVDVWLYEYTESNKEGKLVDITLTDKNGYYEFKKLNATKKYYVKFAYNGMLYTSVKYNMDAWYNSDEWKKTSKAKEVGRDEFNNKFAEIGSYPSNYKIVNKMFGNDLGDYNKVYLQEDITIQEDKVDIFKELSEQIVKTKGDIKKACANVANAHGNDPEIKNKVQFAADCRMVATTDRNKIHVNGGDDGKNYVYPVYNKFTTTSTQIQHVAGETYMPIYEGQRYINYGIKARQTVDLALYKDVFKADVSINGKTETYTYDWLNDVEGKGFAVGVNEKDYLNGLRGAYKNSKAYTNKNQTRDIETDSYTQYVRSEEANNGTKFNSANGGTPYNLQQGDRLNIAITYKISIVNQSSTLAAITEIADYYDNNLEFVSAYVGKENGEKLGDVTKSDNTKYQANSMFKSVGNKYKTLYLTPTAETRLTNNQEQYIFVTFNVVGQNKAGDLLSSVLNSETDKLTILNLSEINGYKTYTEKTGNKTPGLIDIDSNPGNLNISAIQALTQENIINYPNIRKMYEDDTRRAPALIFGLYEERTLSGTVFEDNTEWNNEEIHTGKTRKADGKLTNSDTKIQGVQVELVELKDGKTITRASTLTDSNGYYSFSGFIPGNYTIKYTYGKNQETALSKNSKWYKGVNEKSYNGQDFQSTTFTNKTAYYWYTENNSLSDATDNEARKAQVIAYSDTNIEGEATDYNVAITNHKAEVFKSYEAEQPAHITKEYNASLVNELASKTHRYAYTPEIVVEVEYAKTTATGNQNKGTYKHDITGVDFGIVERPRSELVIDQDIDRIKVTAADGITVLFDAKSSTTNLQWIKGSIDKAKKYNSSNRYFGTKIDGKDNKTAYTAGELASVILDEELMNGAKIEVTWKFTVTNNGETDGESTTAAKTIVDYVANNLDFDATVGDNKYWKVVKVGDVQKAENKTYVNNANKLDVPSEKTVDLSTQSTILQSKTNNPLGEALKPGDQTSTTLTLSKVMATESAADSLSYSNIAEIVEIANSVGRYDRGATPGNQDPNKLPTEHDTAGVEGNGVTDGTVIVIPPTGSQYIYYVIAISSAVILVAGIVLIKKFVIDKKK